MEPDLIDLSTFHDLAKAEIGPFSPKPTSIEGDQLEAVRSFFQSPDGTVDIGIWECTPGRFTPTARTRRRSATSSRGTWN